MDTIFALATVPGKSGVAVVRVSGPDAFESCRIFGFEPTDPRKTSLRRLVHKSLGFIDEAMVILFEKDASFTGERVVEFHLHGSLAIIQAVLGALAKIPGYRDAEAGEFTRRALENGRLDLTQVEALSDLIESETEMQRKQALSGFSGGIREKADKWRTELITALSLLEATIDFADEEVPVDVSDDVSQILRRVTEAIDFEIKGFSAAERIRSGFEVAIVGPPNAGKSTLLNTLAGRDAAITSEVAGTTRDVIEVRMDLDGLPVTFLDTAGIRETEDVIEALGIERAMSRAQEADIRIFLLTGDMIAPMEARNTDITVRGKSDLSPGEGGVSAVTGEGISELIQSVKSTLMEKSTGAGLISHTRQKDCLETGLGHLLAASDLATQGAELYDLASEELRAGVFALERLVGRVDVEDILDKVFSSFCIGK